jgi:diguanylate cyclase (GGDEF)-like protein
MNGHSTTSAEAGDRRLRWTLGVILLFNVLFTIWLLLRPGSPEQVAAVANIAQFTGPLLALFLCLSGRSEAWPWSLRSRSDAPGRPPIMSSLLLSLGVLCFALGQIAWAWYELLLRRPLPLPSWADVGFLAAYPCLLLGILLLPRQPTSAAVRTRLVLDGLMMMTAIATISWYFVLGPTVTAGAGSWLQKAVGAAYPLADLVLIGCLLLLATRTIDPVAGRTVRLLALGISCIIVTDTAFLLQTLAGSYATGALSDVGWPLGYMMVAVAARSAAQLPARAPDLPSTTSLPQVEDAGTAHGAHPPGLRRALLPYMVIPMVTILLVYAAQDNRDQRLDLGVYVGSGVLLALVFLRQIAVIVENARLYTALVTAYTTLERLATIDPLTDLPNHRAMVAAIDSELARAQRWTQPFAVVFLDLDHFKALNDTYGHNIGDDALREFGRVIGTALRATDTPGRWGGEEFIVLLPQLGSAEAREVAERMRAAVAQHPFTSAGIHLTCSAGVATYPHFGNDRNALVAAADEAMYAAKHLGRNQVCSAGDGAVMALAARSRGTTSREEAALSGTVEAMAELVDRRDQYTGRHTRAVAELTVRLAEAAGCDTTEAQQIGLAGRLHDIGKVALPDAVLQKSSGLTAEEWTLIRTHPVVGAEIVSLVPALRPLAPLIRSHHEHWDGGGYPDGLSGTVIPLGARIVAVADAYRAITAARPYQQQRTPVEAVAELERCAAAQFDPSVVRALIHLLAADAASTVASGDPVA